MDNLQAVPALAIREAEQFWTGGENAYPPKPGDEPETRTTCCAGIDLPGVGNVHSAGCPHEGLPRRSGQERRTGETLEPLQSLAGGDTKDCALDDEYRNARERLLSQLIFAARDLAESYIEPGAGDEPTYCAECVGKEVAASGLIAHEARCKTGRVLQLLDSLCALSTFTPGRKETATDGETGRAGDGIRLRVACEAAQVEPPEPLEWIIQRCTQKWVDGDLQYEDFSTPEGILSRSEMLTVLDRVSRANPNDEFRGHRVVFSKGGAR